MWRRFVIVISLNFVFDKQSHRTSNNLAAPVAIVKLWPPEPPWYLKICCGIPQKLIFFQHWRCLRQNGLHFRMT